MLVFICCSVANTLIDVIIQIFNLKHVHRNYFHLSFGELILNKQQDINSYDVMNRSDTTNYQEKFVVYIAHT